MVISINVEIEMALKILKGFLLSTVGTNELFKVSFGRNWTEDVADFLIPNVTQLLNLTSCLPSYTNA